MRINIFKHTAIAWMAVAALIMAGIACGGDDDERGFGRRRDGAGRGAKLRAQGEAVAPEAADARNAGITLTESEREAVEFATLKLTMGPIKTHLSALGKVMAHQQRKAIVSYAFPARIAEILIRIGDWVEKGQPLITLQSEEVGSAKSEFYKAQADYELAQVSLERQKRLFDRGVGAKKDFLSAEVDLKVAETNLNAAEKKLHVLGFTEEQVREIAVSHQINPVITLYAPIAGKIIENNAILGGLVDQATEILILLDPRMLCIDADIYEKDIAKVSRDQKVEVTVPAFPGETFTGETSYISDVLNEETRTITVRTQVRNPDLKLKAGMFADMKIVLNHATRALLIPRDAVLDDKDDKVVFVKREDKFFLQVVELGARENGFLEVLGGLSEGDEVVVKGAFQLKSKLYEEILKKGHVH